MTTDAIIVLERLHWLRDTSDLDPYIWPVLIRIDDNTLTTPDRVELIAHGNNFARVVFRSDTQPPQTADIPRHIGVLRARFDNGLLAAG